MEILGLPCYHMQDVFKNGDAEAWAKFADNRDLKELERMIVGRGYKATCDWPSSPYWEEQMKAFPEAKVVITVRDPERWYESFINTVSYHCADMQHCPLGMRILLGLGLPVRGFEDMTRKIIVRESFKGDLTKENIIKLYKEHIEYVKRVCPKEKLLLFDVKEGWEPLCKFLELPIPNEPFPNLNDTAAMQNMTMKMNIVGHAFNILGVGIPYFFRAQSSIKDEARMSEKIDSVIW
jgi:Sulfotransferase domain